MDYDINNQQILSAGSYYQSHMTNDGAWRPMNSAPHDGTVVEIRCTYGVAPWFGLYRWMVTPGTYVVPAGGGQSYEQTGRWAKVGNDDSGLADEGSWFSWRPYTGDSATYVDPTGGAQDSPAYWRGAVAAKYGLPLNALEARVAGNVSGDSAVAQPEPRRRGFWGLLFGR